MDAATDAVEQRPPRVVVRPAWGRQTTLASFPQSDRALFTEDGRAPLPCPFRRSHWVQPRGAAIQVRVAHPKTARRSCSDSPDWLEPIDNGGRRAAATISRTLRKPDMARGYLYADDVWAELFRDSMRCTMLG